MIRRAYMTAIASAAILMWVPMSATAADNLRDRVAGTWKLVSWETVRPSGQALSFLGLHPTGLLIYERNGYMAVQVMRDPRPTLGQGVPAATDQEIKNAYRGYYAYWGTYTVNEAEGTIEHNIQSSLYPTEVGLKYKRTVLLEGMKLVLTTPSFKAGLGYRHEVLGDAQIPDDEQVFNRLTWERIE
jgi:hypothetical protein